MPSDAAGSLGFSLWEFGLNHAVVPCFANLVPIPSHPSSSWAKISIRNFLQCDAAGWWPIAGQVATHRVANGHLPAVPCIFMRPPPTFDGTSSQAHMTLSMLTITFVLESM